MHLSGSIPDARPEETVRLLGSDLAVSGQSLTPTSKLTYRISGTRTARLGDGAQPGFGCRQLSHG